MIALVLTINGVFHRISLHVPVGAMYRSIEEVDFNPSGPNCFTKRSNVMSDPEATGSLTSIGWMLWTSLLIWKARQWSRKYYYLQNGLPW